MARRPTASLSGRGHGRRGRRGGSREVARTPDVGIAASAQSGIRIPGSANAEGARPQRAAAVAAEAPEAAEFSGPPGSGPPPPPSILANLRT
ncbi:hypothetical protein U1Q18_039064 [Sarracenia purpurea var. burkii]